MLVLASPSKRLDRDAKAEFGIPVRLEAWRSHSNSWYSGTCAALQPLALRFCPGFPLSSLLSSHFSRGLPTNEARFPKREKSSLSSSSSRRTPNDRTKITAERSRKKSYFFFFRYCTTSSPPPWSTLKRMCRTNRHRSSRWYVAKPRGPVPRHRPWSED